MWMGPPVATLAGRTHASRIRVSRVSNTRLLDLIAVSEEEFVKLAATLAADLPRLADLRAALRERMPSSPLTDVPRFARYVGHTFRQMWCAWCATTPQT